VSSAMLNNKLFLTNYLF